jgi:hypothetical protein
MRSTALVLSLTAYANAAPRIDSIEPSFGPGAGGLRVTLRGSNLPLFPFQGHVLLVSGEECTGMVVLEDWRALSCVMPACNNCGDRTLKVVTNAGEESNAVSFHYLQDCYDGPNPALPRRFSGAENCTICTSLVLLTLASSGDLVTYSTLRAAMKDACSSSLLQSWGRVDSVRCRTDLTLACLTLFHSAADALLDSVFSNWQSGYVSGELPLLACREAGQCGG